MVNCDGQRTTRILALVVSAAVVVFGGGYAGADDVNLVSGAKINSATGGRVRGQVTPSRRPR